MHPNRAPRWRESRSQISRRVAEPQILEFATMSHQVERSRDFDAAVSGWGDFFGKNDTDLLHSPRVHWPAHHTGYTKPAICRTFVRWMPTGTAGRALRRSAEGIDPLDLADAGVTAP